MKRTNKGFTLVELVVVIAIIAVLMALVIVTINTVRRQARNTQLRNDAQSVKVALEAYYSAKKSYPATPGTVSVYVDQDGWGGVSEMGLSAGYGDYMSGTIGIKDSNGTPNVNPSNSGNVCYRNTGTNTYELWVNEDTTENGACDDAAHTASEGTNNNYDLAQ